MIKNNGNKVRKLPLPLEIKLGSESSVSDGLFTLTNKEASSIIIKSVDSQNYATVEIIPPQKERKQTLKVLEEWMSDSLIGTELPLSRGKGKVLGKYQYYEQSDGLLYVAIFSDGDNPRRINLGKTSDRNSPIGTIARAIVNNFGNTEFTKKELISIIPKPFSYGQILKGILDVMKIKGYITKKEGKTKKNRPKETFTATAKISEIIVTPEQA